MNSVEYVQYFTFRQMLQKVARGYGIEQVRARSQELDYVAVVHMVDTCGMRERNLLWRTVHAARVET
jgi:hypothetical protein